MDLYLHMMHSQICLGNIKKHTQPFVISIAVGAKMLWAAAIIDLNTSYD